MSAAPNVESAVCSNPAHPDEVLYVHRPTGAPWLWTFLVLSVSMVLIMAIMLRTSFASGREFAVLAGVVLLLAVLCTWIIAVGSRAD